MGSEVEGQMLAGREGQTWEEGDQRQEDRGSDSQKEERLSEQLIDDLQKD